MKHLHWDYKGHSDLDIEINEHFLQSDWNTTLLTKLNGAFGYDDFGEGMNIFASEKVIDNLLKTIIAYDQKTNIIFNKKVIKLDLDTPKIYVTRNEIDDFTMLEHDNYGSVTIKNMPF